MISNNKYNSIFKAYPIKWLLEKNNPSVRYFTLTSIEKNPENDPEIIKVKEEIMNLGIVPKILSKQKKEGFWEDLGNFYSTKYKGTVWQLIILAELGADGNDQRIKNACEFILNRSQDFQSGGFSYRSAKAGGTHSGVFPCLTANLTWSFIRFGYLKDPRIIKALNWITTYQRFDDGIEKEPEGWPYKNYKSCWGKHSCHMGVVKSLKALSEIPEVQRTKEIKDTISKGSEYLLKHHIYKSSHDLNKVSKPSWIKFGFPSMWRTDVLEILGILNKLGYKDKRMQESVDLVVSKQDEKSRWILENTFNGRFQVDIENKGKPSKWITLNAIKVLDSFYDDMIFF